MDIWRIPRKYRRVFKIRLTLLILALLFIFIIVFFKPILSTFNLSKKITVEIYNGCSDFCRAINVDRVTEKLSSKINGSRFRILESKNHPEYRTKLKTEIIVPQGKKEDFKEIKFILPFALVKEDKDLSNKVKIILGIDSIKSLIGQKGEKRIIFIVNKRGDKNLKERILKDFIELNPIIISGDSSIDEYRFINIFFPKDRIKQAKEVKRIFGKEEIKERMDDNYNNVIVVIPSTYNNALYNDYSIVIKKSEFKLYLYKGELLVKAYSIAIGKNPGDKERVGDYRTPEGDFYINSIEDSRSWVHDFGDGKGPIPGAYGPWFLRLYTGADRTKSGKTWEGIGIHGTHDPKSIGKMATEGCIRLKNEDIIELKEKVKIGTPVKIEP
ncbi:MAG: L,D-transpeptidase family protein [bacterium]|nr:L,D-transpeptidase family protein [bacterium]